jgi:hypothetical protein
MAGSVEATAGIQTPSGLICLAKGKLSLAILVSCPHLLYPFQNITIFYNHGRSFGQPVKETLNNSIAYL